MPTIQELETMLAEAKAAASSEAPAPTPGEATFAATTDHPETPEEAVFASTTADVEDAAKAVGDVEQVVTDVESGNLPGVIAPAGDLLSEIHAMVSDIHATIEGIKPLVGELAPLAEKLGNSPVFKMLGV